MILDIGLLNVNLSYIQLYPLELNITHTYNIESDLDPNLLSLDVEENSEIVEDQSESLYSTFNENIVEILDNLNSNYRYTSDLDLKEFEYSRVQETTLNLSENVLEALKVHNKA